MVYPPAVGHPSQYSPGPTWVNFVHATKAANHYATPTHQLKCINSPKMPLKSVSASDRRTETCDELMNFFLNTGQTDRH